jgi:hypothetical protein
LVVLSLLCLDLAFSFIVFRIMYCAVQDVRLARASTRSPCKDPLAIAVGVAKLNLVAILTSVFTTSAFYIMACVVLGNESLKRPSAMANGIFIASWMLDSLSNDLCALLVGLGPTQSALELVSTARDADVIGTPATSASLNQNSSVIGHIILPSDGPVADGHSAK